MTDHLHVPTLSLLLIPKVSQHGDISGLAFSLTIRNLAFKTGDFLCTHGRRAKVHPSSRLQHFLQGIPATVRDNEGTLPFNLAGEGPIKDVHVSREVLGDVVFASDIRAPGADDTLDDDYAPRRDQGGLIGAGWYFLPRFGTGQILDMTVQWDLANCPDGTRALSSFGEGPGSIPFTGTSDSLLNCVFAVGPLRSWPGDLPRQGAPFGGTYWFGNMPENLDAVKNYITHIFPAMSQHFKDSIIDYDGATKHEHDWDLVRLLNRSMVSAWAQLDPEDDNTENDWFAQGLSHLYTVFLSFRFKQRGPDYFRATVNPYLSPYFTNPLMTKSLADLNALDASQDWYVNSAKASRAFVYMLKMDTCMRRAAKARGEDVERPIEDLVRDLCVRRKSGEKVQKEQWLEGIAYWLGWEDAEGHFERMLQDGGRLNELSDMLSSSGATFGPQTVAEHRLEFGLDKKSLEDGVVRDIVPGSRAADCGLRDGDRVVRYSRPEACELYYEKHFCLEVQRDGEPVRVDYWPRSSEKVKSWQVLERPKAAVDLGGQEGPIRTFQA